MKHLKDTNMSYPQHFKRAMSMSLALFVHAFYPNAFPTYASDKMRE
uniref:ORF9 n=1 Tax=Nitrosopumilaceae spindle-shaped virus TaxID=3065433 RepID=A0AAT9JA79_9VIRU